MRTVANDTNEFEQKNQPGNRPVAGPKKSTGSFRPAGLIPLYDREPFVFLVERERARADRAAAKPLRASRQRTVAPAPAVVATTSASSSGQPKPTSEGVWGATTDNREFSLVIFRPRARSDRGGLVELLQCCVRTTDAVGVIDTRRLGVLLPDTAAESAVLFVKKVLTQAQEQGVHLSHVVHTYPAAWPDEESPLWYEPKNQKGEEDREAPASFQPPERTDRRAANPSMMHGLVKWLQTAAFRRPMRKPSRASA